MSMVVRKPGFRIARSYEVAFSPSGDRLACIGVHVDLWDVATRERVARAHPFKHPSTVDFSPDGTRLVATSTSGEVAVLDATSLDVLAQHAAPDWGDAGTGAYFSPDGDHLVDGGYGGLFVREAMSGAVVQHEHDDATIFQNLARTPDRQHWVQSVWRSPPEDDVVVTVRSWPFTDDGVAFLTTTCASLALDPSATRLALLTRHGTELSVWHLPETRETPALIGELEGLPISGSGNDLAWSPSGEMLALAGAGTTRLFASDLSECWRTELEFSCSVEFSPASDLLALGAWSKGFVIATPV